MEETLESSRRRASPMPVEERRMMIATAAIPLFIEQGASVTTRQIADALGIAEGTIFRAFGDKDALIRGVVDAFFSQSHDRLDADLARPGVGLEDKLRILIGHTRERAKGVFAMFSLMDPKEAHGYMKRGSESQFEEIAANAFAGDGSVLNLPPERVGAVLRLVAIAASVPGLRGSAVVSDDELVNFALYGLAGCPRHDGCAGDTSKED